MADNISDSTATPIVDDDYNESPRPFRRERNLSNRNFNKRSSRRRFSTESHSSVESQNSMVLPVEQELPQQQQSYTHAPTNDSSSSSSMQISYSVNSETENAFNRKSKLKMLPPLQTTTSSDELLSSEQSTSLDSPDPALLDVKQKVQRFETFQYDKIQKKKQTTTTTTTQKITTTTTKSRLINTRNNGLQQISPLRVLPVLNRTKNIGSDASESTNNRTSTISIHTSIDEERSEDEVDEISDFENNEVIVEVDNIEVSEKAINENVNENDENLSGNNFGETNSIQRNDSAQSLPTTSDEKSTSKSTKDFPRNFRSTPRPKTEIVGVTNRPLLGKYNSLPHRRKDVVSSPGEEKEDEDEPELRNKSIKFIQPILEELIKTEETYVENLFLGMANYGNIFQRRDLPVGLRGKKYVLFGNIEQIAEFHRDEFLPMLHRNRNDLKRLFDEFQTFIDQNCFYGYVIFTMNKQRSLKLCDVYKNYFKLIQTELDDKLGINSFLVQPIQRMARYPLLLKEFIATLFKHREFNMKPIIESCCRLERKIRILLTTTNESEVINDITGCNEFNVFYQGKFRKVSDFNVFDHTLKRTYKSKVFIFDKCIIYCEIKGKNLIFHGRYPCEHIGVLSKPKSFTLFYERRKQQECDFMGDQTLIDQWLELIRDMVNSYVTEEKLMLQERYSRENDHLHRKPASLSLFRDSNRFSSDSGIGNIWVMPKPEATEDATNNRTTWYAIT